MGPASPQSDAHRIPDGCRDEILAAVRARLEEDELGPPGGNATMIQQVLLQTRRVLEEVGAVEVSRRSNPGFSAAIGAQRATQDVHPSQSLRAAAVLFESALPVVAEAWRRSGVEDPHGTAARLLHRAAVTRIADGAVGYVDTLLARLHTSHADERQRIARELHDRVGHEIAVAMQRLDLLAHRQGADPAVEPAREAMGAALDEVRRLSGDLRRAVDADGLEKAVARLVEDVPTDVECRLEITGDVAELPPALAEEVHLILREAVRNALAHAGSRSLMVSLDAGRSHLSAAVTDTGRGFSPQSPDRPGSGLDSMQERIDLLGGTIAVTSAPGWGTTVRMRVPLPRLSA